MFPVSIAFWNTASRITVSPAVGALALSGQPPVVINGGAIFPSVGAIVFTGQSPLVTLGTGNIARTPLVRQLTITGTQPSIDIEGDQFVTPSARAVAITRSAPVITIGAPLAWFTDGGLTNSANTNPFTYTVQTTIPAGRLVVVMVGQRANTGIVVTSVTDSKGNTYTIDATNSSASAQVTGAIARSRITTGLTPGNTITVTASGALNGGSAAVVGSVANTTASPFDRAASATGHTATPTVSTAATTNARDIVFGMIVNDNIGLSVPSGWTAITTAAGPFGSILFASNNRRLLATYKIVSATGVQTFAPSQGGVISDWVECIGAYKGP